MSKPFIYDKVYRINAAGSLYLANPEPAMEYITQKINGLVSTADDIEAQRGIKCEIFSDFKDIVDYDIKNANRPEPCGKFEGEEQKQKWLGNKQLVQDFSFYLGTIFANYQEWLLKNGRVRLIGFRPFIINYDELYRQALQEYARVMLGVPHSVSLLNDNQKAALDEAKAHKNALWKSDVVVREYRGVEHISLQPNTAPPLPDEHACATTYILPSLIEFSLVTYLENSVEREWLKGIGKLLKQGVVLETEEKSLYSQFIESERRGHGMFDGSKQMTMNKVWNIGVKYGVFSINDKDRKEALCGRSGKDLTIGAILHSDYAKQVMRKPYYMILNYLFGAEYMNIRNCIAHGDSTTYDYMDLGITSVMLQILQDFATDDVVIKEVA